MRLAKITSAIVATVIISGYTFLAFNSAVAGESINFDTPKLQTTEAKLKDVNIRYEKLNTKFHKETSSDQKVIDEQQRQLNEVKKQQEDLQRQLEAKAEQKRKLAEAAEQTLNTLTATQTASAESLSARSYGGSPEQWMAAAGIPQSEWWAVDSIVSRESGWNPCAYNPGQSDCSANPSSACGLAQSLPCGKQSVYGHWTDPVANLKWQYDYVRERYGGYSQAVAFWNANHWY